ncbi:hypothetical protein HanXRQr2_Chr09g0382981 [Helianthus annuus]|uniref:Uncharacterized protein n=1 Tax=Helianthus annuus TaxID=4232 RepID=A0A9K3N7P6_HELAN|nr:hypothetical protein HanXRQr2_Chr09g0382981 [Helianthus annuus]
MIRGPLGHLCKVIDNYGREHNRELQVHMCAFGLLLLNLLCLSILNLTLLVLLFSNLKLFCMYLLTISKLHTLVCFIYKYTMFKIHFVTVISKFAHHPYFNNLRTNFCG